MGGVAEMLINEKAFKALDDADVIFVGEPDFNVDNDVVEGQPFTFTVSGAVVPQMKLSSYDGVSIEMPPDEATDAEVERQLKHLQDVYHSFEKIDDPEHVAEMGDVVSAAVTVTQDGNAVNGLRYATRMIELGSGSMPAPLTSILSAASSAIHSNSISRRKMTEGNTQFGDGQIACQRRDSGIPPQDRS